MDADVGQVRAEVRFQGLAGGGVKLFAGGGGDAVELGRRRGGAAELGSEWGSELDVAARLPGIWRRCRRMAHWRCSEWARMDDLLRGAVAVEPLCPLQYGSPEALQGKGVGHGGRRALTARR